MDREVGAEWVFSGAKHTSLEEPASFKPVNRSLREFQVYAMGTGQMPSIVQELGLRRSTHRKEYKSDGTEAWFSGNAQLSTNTDLRRSGIAQFY